MKPITSLIGIGALSFTTLALAEQETTSPAPEQKPSAGVEQTTTPAPEPRATTATSEQPTTQKKETTTDAAPNQKRTGSAKVSSASVIATALLRKGSVEATLKENENRWEASYAAHHSGHGNLAASVLEGRCMFCGTIDELMIASRVLCVKN
jgi:hypothetical protein